jgi:hypothetical protein
MNGHWLVQSLIAVVLLIPVWLSVSFFERNFHVAPEAFVTWYFLGVAITSALCVLPPAQALFPSAGKVAGMLLIGLTLGGLANVLVFKAVVGAPNPGLAVTVTQVSSLGVFLAAGLLAKYAPRYFSPVKTDWWSLFGIILTLAGISIIAMRRQ